MIEINYRSRLVFYTYTEEVDKEFKNGNVRLSTQKFGGPMTQERYANEILPIVYKRHCYLQDYG